MNGLILWNGPPVEASGGQEQYNVNGLILWNGPPVETSGDQEQYYVEWTPLHNTERQTKWSGSFCNGTGKQLFSTVWKSNIL